MKQRVTALVLAGAALACVHAASAQAVGDARVVPIQVTGDPAARFTLVVLSDGYTAAELGAFRQQLDRHLNILWSIEPFRSYRNYINVYAVEIVSSESGITCDPAVRERRDTPLRMQFGGGCDNPNARGVSIDEGAARRYARAAAPDYDQILAIANTDTYGGIGGSVATTTGGNALSPYVTVHELGHSLGHLQDEYTYRKRGVEGGKYKGGEPSSIHHTRLTEDEMRARRLKWWRWLGEPSEAGGVIGRYEGGQSNVAGIWRPSKHSIMISLGYYFDQVGRERMAQRISAQVELIPASTPTDSPVRADRVLWIETAHPVFHELDVTWRIDGQPVAGAAGRRQLDLRTLGLGPGRHTVTATAVDPTPFVRDPAIRDASFTATRTWTVDPSAPAVPGGPDATPVFTAWTDTASAVAGGEVIYVETTQPADRILGVLWMVDGREVDAGANAHSLALGGLGLAPGTHRVTAMIVDVAPVGPAVAGSAAARLGASAAGATAGAKPATDTLTWRVDNTRPTVSYALSEPIASVTRDDGSRHYAVRDSFTMKLDATDDEPGYVVAEFRVDGDGWHQYYGWPDAPPGTPFLFTPRGTTIKELIYGSLSAEGLSPQPWEKRTPGWGTHTIEYRARDAAGNIGEARSFDVTIIPSAACDTVVNGVHDGALSVSSGVTCLEDATVAGRLTVAPGASIVATNAVVHGDIRATGADAVELIGTTVEGRVRIESTTRRLVLFGNALQAEPELVENRPMVPAAVVANTVAQEAARGGAIDR